MRKPSLPTASRHHGCTYREDPGLASLYNYGRGMWAEQLLRLQKACSKHSRNKPRVRQDWRGTPASGRERLCSGGGLTGTSWLTLHASCFQRYGFYNERVYLEKSMQQV